MGIFSWNWHFSFCIFHFSMKFSGSFQKAKLILTPTRKEPEPRVIYIFCEDKKSSLLCQGEFISESSTNFPWPVGHPRTMKIELWASPSPRPLPQFGGEGKGEGLFSKLYRRNSFWFNLDLILEYVSAFSCITAAPTIHRKQIWWPVWL